MIKDKVAIITGGTRGLGLETARLFLQQGAKVVITGRNPETLDPVVEELKTLGDIMGVAGDVSKEEDVKKTVSLAIEKYSNIDILVNNAGIPQVRKMIDITMDDWNRMIGVTLTGVFLTCREVVPIMLKNKTAGKIVNVSSVSGNMGSAMASAYSAGKAGVLGFTKSIARELAGFNINVNAVCPGAMDTPMFHEGTIGAISRMFNRKEEDLIKSTLSVIPLRRLLQPSEVANLILYLSSPQADGITGQSYNIDCGYDIH